MRPHDGLLGPLHVLYLVHALPPAESNGPPLDAYEHAKSAGARGWKTAVVSTDPSVTEWRHVRGSRVPGEWFTRFAVPVTRSGPETSAARGPESAATKFFRTLLARIEPDLVHVFDEVDLPRGWPDLVAEAGIPVVRRLGTGEDQVAQMDARYREVVRAHPRVMQGRGWRRLRSRDGWPDVRHR
jgi:hypothetical protein